MNSKMGHAHSPCNCKVPINGNGKAGALLNTELLMNALQRRISLLSCGKPSSIKFEHQWSDYIFVFALRLHRPF